VDREVDFKSLVQQASGRTEMGFLESPSAFIKAIDVEKRQITALVSTGGIDRDNEIILPDAFRENLPVYMKNPVVLAGHQHRLQDGKSPVVGAVVKAWIDGSGLWVIIEFAKTALGEEYWILYRDKKQRAFSVGFIPIEHRFEDRNGKQVLIHTKVELLEISCVAVPSNREALSRSKQRKAAFVAVKKEKAEIQELLDSGVISEEKCQEFVELLLGVNSDVSEKECDVNFADIVKGQDDTESIPDTECDFSGLVAG
jgi:HK97 family phage prohead protease